MDPIFLGILCLGFLVYLVQHPLLALPLLALFLAALYHQDKVLEWIRELQRARSQALATVNQVQEGYIQLAKEDEEIARRQKPIEETEAKSLAKTESEERPRAPVERQSTLEEYLPDFSEEELRKKLSLSYFEKQDPAREKSGPGRVPSSVSCDQHLCNTSAPIASVEDSGDPDCGPESEVEGEHESNFFRRSRSLDFRELFSSKRRSKKAHSVQSPERPSTIYSPFGAPDENTDANQKSSFRHSWENRRSSLRRRLSAKRNSSSTGVNSRRRSSLMMVREEGTLPADQGSKPVKTRNSMGGSFQDLPNMTNSPERLSLGVGGSPSHIHSGSSTTSRMKSRMKAAISGKLKSASSAYSLVSNKSEEEKGLMAAPLSPIQSLSSQSSETTPRLRAKRVVEWERLLENCLRYMREVVRTQKIEMLGGSASAVLDVVLQFLTFLGETGALSSSPSRPSSSAQPQEAVSAVTEGCAQLYAKTNSLLKWADDTIVADMMSKQSGDLKQNLQTELSLLDGLSSDLREALMELLTLNRGMSSLSGRESATSNRISTDSGTVVSMGSEEDSFIQEENFGPKIDGKDPPPKPPHPSQQLARRARTESPPALPPRKTPSGTPGAGRRASPPVSGDSGILIDAQLGSASQNSVANGDESRLFSERSLNDILGRLSLDQGGIGTESGASPLRDIDFIDDSLLASPETEDTTPMLSAESKKESVSSKKESEDVQVVEESEDIVDGRRVKTTRIRTTRQMVTKRTTNQERVIQTERTAVPTENLSPELLKMLRESPNGEIRITQRQEANIKKQGFRTHRQESSVMTSTPVSTNQSNSVSYYDNCNPGPSSSTENIFDENGGWKNLPPPPPVPSLKTFDSLEPLDIREDHVFSDYENNNSTPESSPDHKPSTVSRTPKPLPRKSSESRTVTNPQENPPALPPKKFSSSNNGTMKRERRSENIVAQSSSLQSFNRQTIVNGKVVEKDAGNAWDARAMKMQKSATFENGTCIGTETSGSYDEAGCKNRRREIIPDSDQHSDNVNGSETFMRNGVPNQQAPPLPPKNRHVVTYMQIFRPPSVEIKEQNGDGGVTNMKSSALASYVVLRDRLCQHEQAQRQRHFSFAATTSGAGQNSGREGNFFTRASMGASHFGMDFGGAGAQPNFDFGETVGNEYRNLISSWKDTERIQFPKKYPLPEPPPEGKSPDSSPNSKRRLALPVASILGALDASDWLLMKKAPDCKDEVRGGCPDALIVYSTQPGSHILLYQEAFLITYRTFVEPLDLLRRLIWRYRHLNAEAEDDATKRKAARNTFCLIVRVVDTLSSTEVNSEMMSEVNSFGYRLVEEGELTFALLLRRKALERIEGKAGKIPIPPVSPVQTKRFDTHKLCLSDFKSELIAEQMCALDSEFFQKIDLSEMLLWSQEQNEEKSPNLVIFTEHFNEMSFWVRTRVLEPQDHKDREKIFAKFIKIMKVLRRFGNFNSYLAILSALDSGPVRRLEWSKSITEGLSEHSGIMNSSQSFKNYRSALAETKPPCVPYIGLILQDLTFVHIGSPNILAAEMVGGRPDVLNFTKRWQQFTILDSVRRFKSWAYPFKKDDRAMAFISEFDDYLSEDAIWDLSETIKPRGGRQLFK